MNSHLPALFDSEFRDLVRVELSNAYELVGERYYNPGDGADALIFGLMVFKNIDRRFAARLGEGQPLKYVATMRGPELRGGGLRVRWNKVGKALGWTDEVEHPSDTMFDMAAANMAVQQTLGFDRSPRMNWVIAHSGNPRDGLLTIHVAAPEMSEAGSFVAWRQSVAIYSALDPAADFPIVGTPARPEPVDLPDLNLTFLPDEASRAGTDAE